MIVRDDNELQGLKKVGQVVAKTLRKMMLCAEPGMTTKELDDIGKKELEEHGARSAPIFCYDFPGATCICVNEQIAHGIPGDLKLQPGDLINVDVSAVLDGYFGDTGASFILPPESKAKKDICRATKQALKQSINQLKAGSKINSIGYEIEQVAKQYGYKAIRNLGSHGIGRALHEPPEFIAGYYEPRDRRVLKNGQVITVEPFLSTKITWAKEAGDGWTLVGPKGNLTAQYEHTLVVTKDKPILLTLLPGDELV